MLSIATVRPCASLSVLDPMYEPSATSRTRPAPACYRPGSSVPAWSFVAPHRGRQVQPDHRQGRLSGQGLRRDADAHLPEARLHRRALVRHVLAGHGPHRRRDAAEQSQLRRVVQATAVPMETPQGRRLGRATCGMRTERR
eukprot:6255290-Prymnesium_polylepis.2